ncbi:MAG: YcaO-like family protein [Parcubacteria group bacterium]|nr:YcaO-like family protein [Parcubacteria group bacterium]
MVGSLSGSGFTSNDAFAAGLAETIERYSLCSWGHKKFIKGSFEELKHKSALDPLRFKCFSDNQLMNMKSAERHDFNHQTKFNWIGVKSLLTGKNHLVPAQLVYIRYGSSNEPEPIIRVTTTNGAAAGDSWERAAYSAICENVERDALMNFWLNKIAPPQIREESIKNSWIKDVLGQYKRYNVGIKILDITTDIGLPTFMIASIDRSGRGPAVHISNAADLNPEGAILHALRALRNKK